MKVLQVISSINTTGGGPIECVHNFNRQFLLRGHSVEIVSLDPPDHDFTAASEYRFHATGPSLLSYQFNFNLIPWLTQNASRFDAVIVNGIWQFHAFATWLALRKSGIPYYVFTHGMLDPWFKRQYPLKHLKKWAYWPWADYRVLRDARAVLFTTEQERLLARQSFWLYHCNEVVVNLGTASPAGDAAAQRLCFLEQFPHLRGKRLLLFLSRIHVKKGLDLLIDAFARVCNLDPALHLVIAGPDQVGWQVELEARADQLGITQRMTWTGMLQGDLKWGSIYAAEAFCLPSHQENFGIAVAEALACGTPVLISDQVNICEEVRQAGAGLVSSDTLEGTVEVLQNWLTLDPQTQQGMAKAAVELFADWFEISNAAESLLAVIDQGW